MENQNLDKMIYPGVAKLIDRNQHINVQSNITVAFFNILNFENLIVALGETQFVQIMNNLYERLHILSVKYHAIFSPSEAGEVYFTFGLIKEKPENNPYPCQKAMLFAQELKTLMDEANKQYNILIHQNFNSLRNRFLHIKHSEREFINLNDLKVEYTVGIATSNKSSGKISDQVMTNFFQTPGFFRFTVNGGTFLIARKFANCGIPELVTVSENTMRENERLFHFEQLDDVSVKTYGLQEAFKLGQMKSIGEIYPLNSNFTLIYPIEVGRIIAKLLKTISYGQIIYDELRENRDSIIVTLAEFEVFEGSWKKIEVYCALAYLVTKEIFEEEEQAVAMAFKMIIFATQTIKEDVIDFDVRDNLNIGLETALTTLNTLNYDSRLLNNENEEADKILRFVSEFCSSYFEDEIYYAGQIKKPLNQVIDNLKTKSYFKDEYFEAIGKYFD